MKESYPFNIDRQDGGGIPLSTATDHAIDAKKHQIQMFAQDLSRMLRGEKSKFNWQLVGSNGQPVIAQDAKPKHRAPSTLLPKNKATQKQQQPVTPFARQQQSQQSKAELVQRLYGGGGSLEKKFWPDA